MNQKTKFKPQGPEGISYDRATLIKAHETPRFLWGDETARLCLGLDLRLVAQDPHDVASR